MLIICIGLAKQDLGNPARKAVFTKTALKVPTGKGGNSMMEKNTMMEKNIAINNFPKGSRELEGLKPSLGTRELEGLKPSLGTRELEGLKPS